MGSLRPNKPRAYDLIIPYFMKFYYVILKSYAAIHNFTYCTYSKNAQIYQCNNSAAIYGSGKS